MLSAEGAREYSEADALAIDLLFKRLAERGRKIRLQNQTIISDPVDKAGDDKGSSLQTVVAGENGQPS